MGNNLSGAVVAFPSMGAVDLNLWPIPLVGIDTDGNTQVLACTKPTNATSTITGAAPANSNTFVLNGKTYTFKTALTPAEGEILLGANATAAWLNAKNAINSGGVNGTDYQVAAPHPTIQATASNSTTASIRAILPGAAGNLLTTTATGVTVTAATLAGGYYARLLVTTSITAVAP